MPVRYTTLGCGLIVAFSVALFLFARPLVLGLVAVAFHSPVTELTLTVEHADQLKLGDLLDVTLTFTSAQEQRDPRVLYVDLTERLYEAFEPAGSEPAWLYAFDDDIRNAHKLSFDLDLTGGSTVVNLKLKARQPGEWEGQVEYYRTVKRHPAGPPVTVAVTIQP
jgi:hypothetical protein